MEVDVNGNALEENLDTTDDLCNGSVLDENWDTVDELDCYQNNNSDAADSFSGSSKADKTTQADNVQQ